jgi:hypothetical protein
MLPNLVLQLRPNAAEVLRVCCHVDEWQSLTLYRGAGGPCGNTKKYGHNEDTLLSATVVTQVRAQNRWTLTEACRTTQHAGPSQRLGYLTYPYSLVRHPALITWHRISKGHQAGLVLACAGPGLKNVTRSTDPAGLKKSCDNTCTTHACTHATQACR